MEQRELLSVSGIGNETFKTIPFTASGNTTSSFSESGYQFHLTGTANLTKGAMNYTSVNNGTLTINAATNHGALLSVNNGTYSATGKSPNFNGTWNLNGYSDSIVDQSGQLSGSVEVVHSTMFIPTQPPSKDGFTGTYNIASGAFNTANFGLAMTLTAGATTLQFHGTLNPTGAPFSVVVTPTWNADGTIHVGVNVPGKPHTTATADRTVPVTNVQVYWAQGKALKSGVLDSIPVYWNEASGSYTVDISGYASAPAGATGLAFVTRFDGKTTTATLPLPTVSIAGASVAEGNSTDPASYKTLTIPVTLSKAFTKDVTVSYTTFKGPRGTAKPGVDFVPTHGSITIPAGQTQGTISVPIIGNTKYEPNKTFSIKLTQAQNAGINAKQALAVGTILNDDPLPAISIADATVAEPAKGTARMHFVVTLSNASSLPIQVRYVTANDTALAGQDYVRTAGMLTFAPGQLTKAFNITVKADQTQTGDEDFFVNLSIARNATIQDNHGVGTITGSAPLARVSRHGVLSRLAAADLASTSEALNQKKDRAQATDLVLGKL